MTYRQKRSFNQNKAGTRPYWCLQNVRLGFGIGPRYSNAWQAWVGTQQHKGTPPAGLDVPLYFSYTATLDGVRKNWGHIGVRLANGKFWTDGKTYASYTYYANKYAPTYVGWGESINGVRVLEEDVYKGKEAKEWYDLYLKVKEYWLARKSQAENAVKEIEKLREDLSIRPTVEELEKEIARADKALKALREAQEDLDEEKKTWGWVKDIINKILRR